jgi:hypothetical protein
VRKPHCSTYRTWWPYLIHCTDPFQGLTSIAQRPHGGLVVPDAGVPKATSSIFRSQSATARAPADGTDVIAIAEAGRRLFIQP